MQEMQVQTLGREDPLEEGSVLAILFVMTVVSRYLTVRIVH